jgi:alkylation response protein AidB-like acyl-CoA dehydrogenase
MPEAPRIAERDTLLAGVDAVGKTLRDHAARADELRHLPEASVEALEQAGIFRMMWPREFGGYEADPVTQHEVIASLSEHDPSAGWCGFIGAGSSAFVAANLPHAGVQEVQASLPAGRSWARFAGSPQPAGEAHPVDGGYRIGGRWGWLSGVHHSEWVFVGAAIIRNGERTMTAFGIPECLAFVVPRSDVELEDTWHTAGLRGTGSTHCNARDLFVPEHRTLPFPFPKPQRGGRLFHLPVLGFFGPAFSGFPQGVGRRALREITALAETKRRVMVGMPVAERGVFHRDLALAYDRLRGAAALVRNDLSALWQRLHDGVEASALDSAELMSSYSQNADAALSATEFAYRYGGGDSVYASSPLQRLMRDMRVAAQHALVAEHNYEALGRALLPESGA